MENTIKVGYDSKTDLYTFKTPGTYSAKNVCVNGKPLEDALRLNKVGELMTIKEKPESITYEMGKNELLGYDNGTTVISVKEYQEFVNIIEKTRQYDDDEDELVYDSIEDEVTAIRFFKTYSKVYQTFTSTHNMEIEFIEYPVSEYSNIIPLHSIDAKNIFETNCKFIPNNLQIFKDICKARGIDDSRITIPSHSGLRYVQIDKKYISEMEEFQKFSERETIGSYETCINRMNTIKNNLLEIMNFHFAKHSQNVMDKSTVGALLTQLYTLKSSIIGLDVKVKDSNAKRGIASSINDLIDIYKELA